MTGVLEIHCVNSIRLKENIIGGNIIGLVNYDGNKPLLINASDIETKSNYTVEVINNKFIFNKLPPSYYHLWCFESMNQIDPTIYFSGTWQPYQRAARFAFYPDSVEVRARWDIEGIEINFD